MDAHCSVSTYLPSSTFSPSVPVELESLISGTEGCSVFINTGQKDAKEIGRELKNRQTKDLSDLAFNRVSSHSTVYFIIQFHLNNLA